VASAGSSGGLGWQPWRPRWLLWQRQHPRPLLRRLWLVVAGAGLGGVQRLVGSALVAWPATVFVRLCIFDIVVVLVGEYGIRKRSVTAYADRQPRAMCTKWSSAGNNDLMRMLTLLESVCRASAPKVRIGRETRLSESAPMTDKSGARGGLRRPFMDVMARWAVSALKVRRTRWPWLYQKGTVTCKRARRVKVAV
jgi:hypothetical protein